MDGKPYLCLIEHYERCLAEHGDTPRGVDWPRAGDVEKRYAVMWDLVRPPRHPERPPRLLDLGCGAGHFLECLRRRGVDVAYEGLDLSPRFVELCRSKFPGVTFHCLDLLDAVELPRFDYVVMNGVFTEKRELTFEAMLDYFQRLVRRAWELAEIGVAFNVMSKQVDWERPDLFHVPLDLLATFLTRDLSRHFVIRHDYGLYEYTCHVYREPAEWRASSSSA